MNDEHKEIIAAGFAGCLVIIATFIGLFIFGLLDLAFIGLVVWGILKLCHAI